MLAALRRSGGRTQHLNSKIRKRGGEEEEGRVSKSRAKAKIKSREKRNRQPAKEGKPRAQWPESKEKPIEGP
jgi:hypothetical protein